MSYMNLKELETYLMPLMVTFRTQILPQAIRQILVGPVLRKSQAKPSIQACSKQQQFDAVSVE